VPFYLRAGKRLPVNLTEVIVELKPAAQRIFDNPAQRGENYYRFRLGPGHQAIGVGGLAKQPGLHMVGENIELSFCDLEEGIDAYDRLIGDALVGDRTLFAREDGVEESWRIIDEVLRSPPPVHEYEPGTWGPAQIGPFMDRPGGWLTPAPAAVNVPSQPAPLALPAHAPPSRASAPS
jgi:glucose-6-phosphate 1-dehydrogenase